MTQKNRTRARGEIPAAPGGPVLSGAAGRIGAGYGFLMLALASALSLGLVFMARRDGGRLTGAAAVAARMEAGAPAGDGDGAPPVGVVDSVFPIEEEMRRFRADLPEVTALSGGAASRDRLVEGFLGAVARADTAALAEMLITRAEFGWLYYPHTIYTARPYELSPALLWFQMQNLTSSGLSRVLKRAAEAPLDVTGYRCEEAPKAEGPNRVWSECRVFLETQDAESSMQLFGTILERGGVYKFVSYASDL